MLYNYYKLSALSSWLQLSLFFRFLLGIVSFIARVSILIGHRSSKAIALCGHKSRGHMWNDGCVTTIFYKSHKHTRALPYQDAGKEQVFIYRSFQNKTHSTFVRCMTSENNNTIWRWPDAMKKISFCSTVIILRLETYVQCRKPTKIQQIRL